MENIGTTGNKNSRITISSDPSEAPPATHADEARKGATISLEPQRNVAFLLSLKTPSKYWAAHCFPDSEGVLYCPSVLWKNSVVTSEKVVVFVFDRWPGVWSKVNWEGVWLTMFTMSWAEVSSELASMCFTLIFQGFSTLVLHSVFLKKLENLLNRMLQQKENPYREHLGSCWAVWGRRSPTASAVTTNLHLTIRLHFFAEGTNSEKRFRRKKVKHLKISQCSRIAVLVPTKSIF